jgi:predicted esterase
MCKVRLFHLLCLMPTLLISCQAQPNSNSNPQTSGVVQKDHSTSDAVVEGGSRPIAPLTLAEPDELPKSFEDINLEELDADELYGIGRTAAAQNVYNLAAIAHYWYVRKTDLGQYDLACYLARSGQTEAAFYWLQIAAMQEGVDSEHAQRDEDLETLRKDNRWKQVLSYINECNRYFETANTGQTILILPTGYQMPAAIPAVVWLHGLGSRPDDFVNESCQGYADRLNIAFIGASGTKPRGPARYVWAEDLQRDAERIRNALTQVSDRVLIKKGQIITFGFSQGAQVGLEVAVQSPEEFAGSIVLSPGADPHLNLIPPSPLLADRRFVISLGAVEAPGNIWLASNANEWLRKARAQVIYKPYPGVATHSFPADFSERFPEWVNYILKIE